jgi:hypothetical protein
MADARRERAVSIDQIESVFTVENRRVARY